MADRNARHIRSRNGGCGPACAGPAAGARPGGAGRRGRCWCQLGAVAVIKSKKLKWGFGVGCNAGVPCGTLRNFLATLLGYGVGGAGSPGRVLTDKELDATQLLIGLADRLAPRPGTADDGPASDASSDDTTSTASARPGQPPARPAQPATRASKRMQRGYPPAFGASKDDDGEQGAHDAADLYNIHLPPMQPLLYPSPSPPGACVPGSRRGGAAAMGVGASLAYSSLTTNCFPKMACCDRALADMAANTEMFRSQIARLVLPPAVPVSGLRGCWAGFSPPEISPQILPQFMVVGCSMVVPPPPVMSPAGPPAKRRKTEPYFFSGNEEESE